MLEEKGTTPLASGASLADLIRRPQLCYDDLAPFDTDRPALSRSILTEVEISLKYEGYIARQLKQVAEFTRLETYDAEHNIFR